MTPHRRYSKQEDDFICTNYRAMSYGDIGKHLGRSRKAVSNRAQRLGLSKLKRWTDEEDKFIWDSEGIPIAEVAKQLGRRISEVSSRWKKIGDGISWAMRGGYKPDRDGGVVVGYERKNGYSQRIMEHRFVVSQHLERDLLSSEIVHHINATKADNRIENLFLCESRRHHRQVHHSFERLLPCLLDANIVCFNRDKGIYELCVTSK